jgi:hypothetical protein
MGAGIAAVLLLGGGLAAASLSNGGDAGASTTADSPMPLGSAAPAAITGVGSASSALTGSASQGADDGGCAAPTSPLQMQCMIHVGHGKKSGEGSRSRATVSEAAATLSAPIGPSDLQAAYGLASAATSGGAGETVAIVDAFGDSHITGDLASYRSQWHLPACDPGTGAGCLSVFNESGAASPLPDDPIAENLGWEDETALDVDMVSAICPNCHVDLFQASDDDVPDLGTAVNSAARVAKFISGSWGGADFPGESSFDATYFNHPGVVTDFAAGDDGYGPSYPASSGLVTAVGGTYLTSSGNARGYLETTWNGTGVEDPAGTGTGCSSAEGKPSWQTDGGCLNRTETDVSAVADSPYGIDIYSSSGDCDLNGAFDKTSDCMVWGTSASTPIITSVYALALPSGPMANTYPASYPYLAGHRGNASDFTDVTSGQVGACESARAYLCRAQAGYDGPTGWGTPNGTGGFTAPAAGTHVVSVVNPGSYDLQAGSRYALPAIKAYDSVAGTLTYSATGLPSGLAINAANGVIEGLASATPANATVRVTVKDATGASSTITFRIVTVKSLTASYHRTSGQFKLDLGNLCLNDARAATGNGAPIETYTCENVATETGWSYVPSTAPGVAATVQVSGKCLYVTGSGKAALYACNGSTSEKWEAVGVDGELVNMADGFCLNDPNASKANNTQLTLAPCNGEQNQAWLIPGMQFTSGVAGKCLSLAGSGAVSTACAATAAQYVTLGFDGTLQINGKCLYKTGTSFNDGTLIGGYTCNGSITELWGLSAYGQIENLQTSKCLAVLGNSATNGAKVVIEDCYNAPGEVWG